MWYPIVKRWPLNQYGTLFQTCLIISSLVQNVVKGIAKGFCSFVVPGICNVLVNSDEKDAFCRKTCPIQDYRVQKPYPIGDPWNGQNQHPISDQND